MNTAQTKFNISVTSEIGELEGVILHTPGLEIENMTPMNVERALYSDILNLSVANCEYKQLQGALAQVLQTGRHQTRVAHRQHEEQSDERRNDESDDHQPVEGERGVGE